jgi:hypothetical protein
MIEKIYNEMLLNFQDTLESTSKDSDNSDKMTACQNIAVNIDKLKDHFARNMGLEEFPKSCDALYMTPQKEFFMIEFKNGRIGKRECYEIREKVFESLLMLSEKFVETIKYMRDNMNFILVYNEDVAHEQGQLENRDGIRQFCGPLYKRARVPVVLFGLRRFKKLYFKDVFTYSRAEFESEFVGKVVVGQGELV